MPIEIDERKTETPSSRALGKDDLINKISKVRAKEQTYCFEVQLRSDYESLHMLNNVNDVLTKRSQSLLLRQPRKLKLNRSARNLAQNLTNL